MNDEIGAANDEIETLNDEIGAATSKAILQNHLQGRFFLFPGAADKLSEYLIKLVMFFPEKTMTAVVKRNKLRVFDLLI